HKEEIARLDMFIDGARKRSDCLYMCFTVAQTVFLTGSVVAQDSPEVARALRFSAQALSAMFANARFSMTRLPIAIGEGPPVTFSQPNDPGLFDWQHAYFLSVITRQRELLQILRQTLYTFLMHPGTATGDIINFQYIDLLKAIYFDKNFGTHPVLRG